MSPVNFSGGGLDLPDIPEARLAAEVAGAESEMKVVLNAAGQVAEQDLRSRINDRSGKLDRSVVARVRVLRGKSGAVLSIGPNREVSFATRKGPGGGESKKQDVFPAWFVEEGTGIHGPLKRLIKNRGRVPVAGGWRVPSGRGQKPQRIFQAAREHYANAIAPVVDRQVTEIISGRISGMLRQRVNR